MTLTQPESAISATPPKRAGRAWLAVVFLIVVGAGAVRVAAARDAFWVDEIFSLDIARSCKWLFQSMLVPSDNNHPLNTAWLHLLGEQRNWVVYRSLSVVCGTLSVAFLALLLRRNGQIAALVGAIIAGGSYFLIHYGSEARGYAPAIMFAVLCACLLRKYIEKPSRRLSLSFALCALLGMLSHPTFLFVYLGLLAWSLSALKPVRTHVVRLHAVPLTFIALFYLLFLRRLTPGGGPPYPAWRAARDAISWTMGWPRSGWMTIAVCAATAFIFAIELVRMMRDRESEWLLYAVAVLVAPALALLVWRERFVYPRYFAVCVPFVLILISRFLARAWHVDLVARAACVLFLGLFLWGNYRQVNLFLETGRGGYLDAIHYMCDGGNTTVGSLQDQRNSLVFGFYNRYLRPGEHVEYIRQEDWTKNAPRWIVVDGVEWSDPVATARIRSRGYMPVHVFRNYGLSGFDWWIFEVVKLPRADVPSALPATAPARTPQPPADRRR